MREKFTCPDCGGDVHVEWSAEQTERPVVCPHCGPDRPVLVDGAWVEQPSNTGRFNVTRGQGQ